VARLTFTANLRRHVDCPAEEVAGATVAECLGHYFERYPMVRSYILDERGYVRRHVVVFVGRTQILDPKAQSDSVSEGSEIYVMQALSGGCS
jgi:sulfur-carrier protein